ncbi:MAG: hypothetical protein E7J92_27880 [Pseudomonas aeruginosa]|nr:hypothetical protein [Pseudomonas aeruginosa]
MATVNSTETPVFSGWHMFATGACHGAEHEKISSSASVLNAISLIGKTVLVELVWEDDSETLWRCVRIAGVVLALEGVYEHPHFMVFSLLASLARKQGNPGRAISGVFRGSWPPGNA